jgi:hypothetical protein
MWDVSRKDVVSCRYLDRTVLVYCPSKGVRSIANDQAFLSKSGSTMAAG